MKVDNLTLDLGYDDTIESDRHSEGYVCELSSRLGCNIPGCPHKEVHEELEGCQETYCKILRRKATCKKVTTLKYDSTIKRFDVEKWDSIIGNALSMDPLSFQKLVTGMMGECSPSLTNDGGIDGITEAGIPIQVKRTTRTDKNAVTLFASALKKLGYAAGIIVAFSFRDSAYQQSLWIKKYDNIEVELLPFEHLIKMDNAERREFCEGEGWQSHNY